MQFTGRAVNPVCCAVIFKLAGLSSDVRRPQCSAGFMCMGLEQKQFLGVNVNVKKEKEKKKRTILAQIKSTCWCRGLFQFQVSGVFKSA